MTRITKEWSVFHTKWRPVSASVDGPTMVATATTLPVLQTTSHLSDSWTDKTRLNWIQKIFSKKRALTYTSWALSFISLTTSTAVVSTHEGHKSLRSLRRVTPPLTPSAAHKYVATCILEVRRSNLVCVTRSLKVPGVLLCITRRIIAFPKLDQCHLQNQ